MHYIPIITMTSLISYKSPEYPTLVEVVDKNIALMIEGYIYEWKEEKHDNGNHTWRVCIALSL